MIINCAWGFPGPTLKGCCQKPTQVSPGPQKFGAWILGGASHLACCLFRFAAQDLELEQWIHEQNDLLCVLLGCS